MTYYVDTSGSDSNTGASADAAWQTLSKVSNATFSAGDTILFKRGQTWTGGLSVHNSGTTGSYITYAAYGSGAKPIISGGIIVTDKSYIILRELIGTGATGAYASGIKLVSNTVQMTNLTVDRCETHTNDYAGIWVQYGTDITATDTVTIDGCTVYGNTIYGVLINGQDGTHRMTNIVITNNEIYDNGNITDGQHGLQTTYTVGAIVNNNHVHGNAGYLDWSGGIYITTSTDMEMAYNIVHDNIHTNIHFDVHSNGFNCHHNISYNAEWNGYWIEEHLVSNGTSILANNTSYNDGSGLYIGPGSTIHEVSGVTIVNNLFIGCTSVAFGIDASIGGVIADNFNNTIDYNDYTITGAAPLFRTVAPNNTYALSGWRTLTGYDAHSLTNDPLLLSPGNLNFNLSPSSLCIGYGQNMSYTRDYTGSPIRLSIDLGAIQSLRSLTPVQINPYLL